MQQAWHILKKDIRYLRIEIGIVVALAAVFGWMHHRTEYPWWALLAVAAAYLIVRLIHAEAIPGDDQFWITRPYRWQSLIGAKLAFIVLFVNLPVFIAQLIVFIRDGFPVVPNLPGLLWSFGLMIFGVAFPIAALAALTSGIMPFILSGILVVAIAGSILQDFSFKGGWFREVEWIRYSILASLVMAVACWALYAQYKTRRTFMSRAIVVFVAAFALVLSWQVPVEWGLALQSRFSGRQFDSESFRVELSPEKPPAFRIGTIGLSLPVIIRNVPDGLAVRADHFHVELIGPNGEVWSPVTFFRYGDGLENHSFTRIFAVPRQIYDAWHGAPVTIRGMLYLTAFGSPQEHPVTVSDSPVDVISGLQCFSEEFRSAGRTLSCRSPFRSPKFLVSSPREEDRQEIVLPDSYSPFPAGIDLNRQWLRHGVVGNRFVFRQPGGLNALSPGQQVTLGLREPVGHFRRDFQLIVDLDDFVTN